MLWVCNHLQKFYTKTNPAVRLEEATVIFMQGQRESGIMLAKKLVADLEGNAESKEQLQVLSKTYLHLGNWLNEQKSEANNKILEKAVNKEHDLKLPKVIKERFCKLDATEVEQYKIQLLDYLKMSLDNYLSVMILGSKSLAVYRLVSLWFNEGNNDITEVGELIQAKLPSVSS